MSTRNNHIVSGHSFSVSDVVRGTEPLRTKAYYTAVSEFLRGTVEACSNYHGQLLEGISGHPLVAALHLAFAGHRPVELSPDVIWLTLTQGLAHHINQNAERIRQHFVQHDGRKPLYVRRDDFLKGSPENPWTEVFEAFSTQIRDHIGPAHELILADFSTTGPVERAASEVVLMDAMQSYFEYRVTTLCGIPNISLRGTVSDWEAIRRRVQDWSRFDLAWWVQCLLPVLDQFVAAAAGHPDRQFWTSIYKYRGAEGSGGPHISGWIGYLFPYVHNGREQLSKNPELVPERAGRLCGVNDGYSHVPLLGDFPALPAKVPFVWQYFGTEFQMEFIGGLIGVHQDNESLCLRPEIGWVVRNADAEQAYLSETHIKEQARLYEAEREHGRRIVDLLGPENPATRCRADGCDRGSLSISIYCLRHHFENILHTSYPLND